MELGMLGLGRMGGNMVRRLLRGGHRCVVYDRSPVAREALQREGAHAVASPAELAAALAAPRISWIMVPAAAVEATVTELSQLLSPGDILVDGGNSNFQETMRRGAELSAQGLHFVDVGTSGGIWGLEHGYCLMIGGEAEPVAWLEPIFRTLAPGPDAGEQGRGSAASGYLHCGPVGSGHYVKMVHNGIEYGLMAAYAEGMNLLHAAGKADAGGLAAPLDVAAIAQLWRRGSVVRSWLLDLIAQALERDPDLAAFRGQVGDSGEGRWTIKAGIDAGVPLPVLSAALYARFSSRGAGQYADKLLSAMRHEFGGHGEAAAPDEKP